MSEIIFQKSQSLSRCLARVAEEVARAGKDFDEDYSARDAATLNIIRACELAIDMANHWAKQESLGLVTDARSGFVLLEQKKMIDTSLMKAMVSMVGFRNVAVHDYVRMDDDIFRWVITERVADLQRFADTLLQLGE